jgi:hypothetical protein
MWELNENCAPFEKFLKIWDQNENNPMKETIFKMKTYPYEHFDLKNVWEPNENCAPFEKFLKLWDQNEDNPMKETIFKM